MTTPEPTERFEWAYRWLEADGYVLDEMPTQDNIRETAEQRAYRLAANRPAGVPRGQVVRYRVVTTEEVVAAYPARPTPGLPGGRPSPECTTSRRAVHRTCDGCTCTCHAGVIERQRDMATDQRNDAYRIVEESRMEAAALLNMERGHFGSGRDGHISETDLIPLLRVLQVESPAKD
ncbi:hypothetical protein ABZ949_01775 [Micromonospora tulbaghiae]|uniref:hypothetical protein n=1 Tax=Micromonospora tulbaghiae TaxID=479978 RepID=UPI0034000804